VLELDFAREQRRSYRFHSRRQQEVREAWFACYQPVIDSQLRAWSGRDFRDMSELELRRLARKGIPAVYRATVWSHALHLEQIKKDNPGKYG
jgi:hypothetical protein